MAPQSVAVPAGTTSPTANVPATPTRKIASFRTLGWLRGVSWGQHAHTTAQKKQDEAVKENSTVIEDVAVNSSAIVPFRSTVEEITIIDKPEKEIERPPTRQSSGMEITRSRVASPVIRDTSPFAGSETRSNNPPVRMATPRVDENEEYILNAPQEANPDTFNGDDNNLRTMASGLQGGVAAENTAGAVGMGKKGSGKLTAALNMIRRRSNSNVRKEAAEGEDSHGMFRRRGSVDHPPRKSLFSPTLALTTASPPGSSAPTRRTTRLQKKTPPADRHRKSRAGSTGLEDPFITANSRSSGWDSSDVRLSSSQSSVMGALVLRDDNCTQMTPDATMITGGNAPGGLFPRPSSVKRNFSDGPQGRRESTSRQRPATGSRPSSANRAIENGSATVGPRTLPLSAMNPYGTMKITEAASIESRVKELENRADTFYEFMKSLQASTIQRRSSEPTTEMSHSVHSQFRDRERDREREMEREREREETAFGKRPDTANTMSTFRNVNYSEMNSDVSASVSTEGPQPWRTRRPPSPMEASATSSYILKGAREKHERQFNALRHGPASATETEASKRTATNASMSTITPSHHHRHHHHHHHDDRGRDEYHRPNTPPQHGVPLEEFRGILNLVKQEQQARMDLEQQIVILQRQIALVQHRQLVQMAQGEHYFHQARNMGNMGPAIGGSSSYHPAVTGAPSSSSLGPGFQSLQRKTSSEVPTPDHTPPRANGDRSHGTLFEDFDGVSVSAHDSDRGDNQSYVGVEDEEEFWEVPSETARPSPVDTMRSVNLHHGPGVHLAPPQPTAAQKRTMSISQITEKASLAAAVRMNHHHHRH